MGESLLKSILYKAFLLSTLLFVIALQGGYGQTSLSAGDLAFTGFNAEGSASNDGFAVVFLNSVSGNQVIHFSSYEWNGSSFVGTGGDFTWTAPSNGVSSGTVLEFTDVEDLPTVELGAISDDANMNLSGDGDVVYAYTSTIDKNEGDYSFLGAIASEPAIYDGGEGTIPAELSDGTTAILLPTNIDNAEYIGDRSGNTAIGYRTLLNDIGSKDDTDDNWEMYNGSDIAPFPPFNDESFTIVSPPTISFTKSSVSASEGTSIDLTVELLEANNDISVDVSFLNSSSSADASDLNEFSSETIDFTNISGEVSKTVSITLTDSDGFEGIETAVFQLQNTTASTIKPSTTNIDIIDGDSPAVVINEFLADPPSGPPGNANGDGSRGTDDEFVELVNMSGKDIDMSGWQISDEANGSAAHTFPAGTVLSAGQAVVVFSSGNPTGSFGGAIVQTASGGSISLKNSGDTIQLLDKDANQIDAVTYGSEGADNESLNRDPDGTSSGFAKHSTISNASGNFSPGTQVDGTPFGSDHAIAIHGNEGWRMMASPVQNATFNDLFGQLWMQGVTGSDDDSQGNGGGTLFGWDESGDGTYTTPSSMDTEMTPGKGYFVYVFEDDEYNTLGIQGGFPKIIQLDGNEHSDVNNISVSATDNDDSGAIDAEEGWNLLGNPFGTDIIASAVISELETAVSDNNNVNANLYVWDHDGGSGNGDWVELSGNETIAPFQAFFVRYTTPLTENISFAKSKLEANQGTDFYKSSSQETFAFDLNLHGEQYFDTYTVEFSENGSTGLDRYDAYKLFSLNSNSINLFSTLSNNRLQKNVLPKELESSLEIPLFFDAQGRSSMTFKWDNKFEDIPSEWEITLTDKENDREIDLRRSSEYSFTAANTQKKNSNISSQKSLLNKAAIKDYESRFILSISPRTQGVANNDIPESAKLNPNYPNPFNPQTTIPYEVTEDAQVKLTVWNMIGQKVATLVDGVVEAGSHQETWNAASMPSGIYIARFEVGSKVFTRKMTLIK
jgi:hypothetical protein